MPELPDVEWLRRYFDETALHKTIDHLEIKSPEVIKNISSRQFKSKLTGKTFEATRRHGKFMFAGFKEWNKWLVIHLGMTGDLKYYKREEAEPEYELVKFNFKNEYHLAYIMVRKLGELEIIANVEDFVRERNLGPDVFDDSFSFDKFQEILDGRRGMIKTTLMNQSIMAGIGNVYSDEILFQAKVHPETKVNKLDQATVKKIYTEIDHVLQTAINRKAQPQNYPRTFITPLRDQDEAKCPRCGGSLKRIKVSGRSALICPACQS